MPEEKKDIKSLTLENLKLEIESMGEKRYKALQIYQWITKNVKSFEDMRNLPNTLKEKLNSKYYISTANIVKKSISKIDGTVKYLFSMADGALIESVVMQYKHGYSICISTQVGCKMACDFCATGKQGFRRNLLAGEMLSQIQQAQDDMEIRISNIVLMGMGEPLDNYKNTIDFLRIVSSKEGLNIGMRHISLSTSGVVDKIYELANLKLQLTLSVSLHAPNNEIRNKLMPINKRYPIEELIKSCKYYIKETGRRISFEYALISGLNDSIECATILSNLLKHMLCHVNLIPINSVAGVKYKKSSRQRIESFKNELERNKITTTIRRTLGADVDASCGQLKQRYSERGM